MIRLVQNNLIVPRGDTGTFSIPVLSSLGENIIGVFTILDPKTNTKIFQKQVSPSGETLTVTFSHGDTVNLPVGKYLWDIKFYENPVFVDEELVDGVEVDSYYAAYKMPICEIRQTGDKLLTADGSPTTTLAPETVNFVTAAISEIQADKNIAANKAQEAAASAADAKRYAEQITDLTATAETLPATASATASYNAETGVLTIGIPEGKSITSTTLNQNYTLTISFNDGTSITVGPIRGEQGVGIESIVKTGTSGLVDIYTITYTNGSTSTFRVTNGITPHFSIGAVTEGATAAASITGTNENPVLNLVLPNANVPTKVSELENDAGYLTEHQDLSNYVQKTDYPQVNRNVAGIVKIDTATGLSADAQGLLSIYPASGSEIKTGTNSSHPITPKRQHISTFYGLAKAAGVDEKDSELNFGTYTDEAKAAIQTMLDVPSNADVAAKQDALTFDSTPTANSTNPVTSGGVYSAIANVNTMKIHICVQGEYDSETGVPTIQNPDTQTFYLVPGGADNNLFIEWAYVNGTWERFGSADVEVPVTDVQVNGISVISNGVAEIPIASTTQPGVGVFNPINGVTVDNNGVVKISPATDNAIKIGTNLLKPIVAASEHTATFYGLARAAGDSTQSASSNAVGTYTDEAKVAIQQMLDVPSNDDIPDVPVQDVQVNGTSVVTNGVANVPIAANSTLGVAKGYGARGIAIDNNGNIYPMSPSNNSIKSGVGPYAIINVDSQHKSAFYGFAKAAGDTTQSQSSNAVGNYTDNAKEAIQSMLGITQMLAPTNPNLVASQAYAIGDVFAANGHLYKATAAIAQDGAIIPDTNCVETTVVDESVRDVQVAGTSVIGSDGVANVPIIQNSSGTIGVVRVAAGYGVSTDGIGTLSVTRSPDSVVKNGSEPYRPIAPVNQHLSTFYGLSKAAGVDLANETVTLGTYPETSKTAIKEMLGVQDGLKVVRLI